MFFVYKSWKLSHSRQGKISFRAAKFFSLGLFAYVCLQFPHINVNFVLSHVIAISSWQRRQENRNWDILLSFCHSCYFMSFIQISDTVFYFVFLLQVQLQTVFLVVMNNIYKTQFIPVFCLLYICGRLKISNFFVNPTKMRDLFLIVPETELDWECLNHRVPMAMIKHGSLKILWNRFRCHQTFGLLV